MLSNTVTIEELLHYTADLENLKAEHGITYKEIGERLDEIDYELAELDTELFIARDCDCLGVCEGCDNDEINAIKGETDELKCERDQLKQLLLAVPWD